MSRSALPGMDEYQLAVQNPATAFADPDLRTARVETSHFGLPRVMSGGFVLTYHLTGAQGDWAVRCFKREVPELEQRYASIGRFLARKTSSCFVPFSYLDRGINTGSGWYPIIKMQWVEGDPLNLAIESKIRDQRFLRGLPEKFRLVVGELQHLGMAHGDLQHGNVLFAGDELVLVDYDGMYVPGLGGLHGGDIGHVNYQHPRRTARDFGPQIDRFSVLVIHMALQAIAQNPDLWFEYSDSENLLFKQADILNPHGSLLLADLERIPSFVPLVRQFRAVCLGPLADVPTLDIFLSDSHSSIRMPAAEHAGQSSTTKVDRQYDVLAAIDVPALLHRVGDKIEVVGLITAIRQNETRKGRRPYIFLSFGDYRSGCFTLMLWSHALALFNASGQDPFLLVGKWVSVTGLITRYNQTPQINIEMPSQIRQLSGDEQARGLLQSCVRTSSRTERSTASTSSETHEQIMERLYGPPGSNSIVVSSAQTQSTSGSSLPKQRSWWRGWFF